MFSTIRFVLPVVAVLSVACVASEEGEAEPATAEAQSGAGDCDPASACEVAYLDELGVCVRVVVPGCNECEMADGSPGTTRDGGECCAGCWAGPTCRVPGDLACGAGGGLCEPCDGAEMCVDGKCQIGAY